MPRAGFNLTWNVKYWFFDRERVRSMLRITTRGALSKAGALVRTIARRSMRYVTSLKEQQRQIDAGKRKRLTGERAPSAPGTPPHAVRPHPWIRQHLYYAYDPGRGSVVIGPVRLFSQVNVPALHEFGGRMVLRNRRRRTRKVGSGGEIRIGGRPCRTTRSTQARHGNTVQVTYARLRTGAQVARANDLNEQLYGPASYIATYPPRPFMAPVLAAVEPGLARLWLTSVRVA
ncbi:MAG TPA: hypothetical protein VMW48_20280 [Vicinamibacterales bacterium]|nr:hypothetical protein [Vicinamibacterales bacterium]